MTLYLELVFEICETLKFKKLATKMEPLFNSLQESAVVISFPGSAGILFTFSGFFWRPPCCSWGKKSYTEGL